MAGFEAYIPLASVLLSGGLILGLLRIRPEASSLSSTANEAAVRNLLASMANLETRLTEAEQQEARLRKEIADLRTELAATRRDLIEHQSRVSAVRMERDAWKQRALDLGWSQEGLGEATDGRT